MIDRDTSSPLDFSRRGKSLIGQKMFKILDLAKKIDPKNCHFNEVSDFGDGNSDKVFLELIAGNEIWRLDCQKQFQDIGN